MGFCTTQYLKPTESKTNCLTKHVNDAITLNHERKLIYAKVSHGFSIPISDQLIALEESMGTLNMIADFWAKLYQRKGIHILCDDLVDMKQTPSLPQVLPTQDVPRIENFKYLDSKSMQNQLRIGLDMGYLSLAEETKKIINQLADEPRFNCMTRHFLESIYIFSVHGDTYVQKIAPIYRGSLRFFLRQILNSQIHYLQQAAELDQKALSLQLAGIPILCQDVPHIPTDLY